MTNQDKQNAKTSETQSNCKLSAEQLKQISGGNVDLSSEQINDYNGNQPFKPGVYQAGDSGAILI